MLYAGFDRAESSARQYRAEAEEKVNVQFKLRQQLALNDRLQNKLAGLQANKESVQQHRHEVNRCLDALAVVQGEKRQMQKRMDELEAAVETANARCVCLSACYVKYIVVIINCKNAVCWF